MRRQGLEILSTFLLLAAPVAGNLLAQSSAGALRGRVTDESNAALAGVTVTALHAASGFARTALSEADGVYRFPSLPVGDYDVKAELPGFASMQATGVRLDVASQRVVDFSLPAAAVEEQITMTSDAPLVDESAAIGTIVSRAELENLPLDGRQYATLASLAPGTTLSFNADPSKPGQAAVALHGGSGRNVTYLIDGGDNNDDFINGALLNLGLESVEELRIQTQQYKAEYGRTSGGVVTVVTKSGTNELGGSAFGYFRDDSLNGKTRAEDDAGTEKSPYERQQYGFAIGGPLVRDRAHFFAAYERLDRETEYLVNSGGIDPGLDGTVVGVPFDDELASVKATVNLSREQFLQVRYAYQKNSDKYGATPLNAPDSLATITNESDSLLAGHTWQISPSALNEALVQYSSFDETVTADSNNPAIFYPSGYDTGQSSQAPQSFRQRKTQLKDDVSWSMMIGSRRHDMKAGINYIDEPTLDAAFSTGVDGQFYSLEDAGGSPISTIVYFDGVAGVETPIEQYSVFVEDDWYVNDRLTVNAGLRYDYWSGFDLDQRSNAIWQELSTQTTYDDYYLRDFQGGKGGVLENDDDNWGPRIAFTYDLHGDAKSFVRGGWGVYHDFPYTGSSILFPTLAVQSTYGISYYNFDPNGIRNPDGSFWRPGDPLPPNQLPPDTIFVVPPNEVASPTLATPQATQLSLGYATELGGWIGLTVDLVSIRYRDIPYRFRANAFLDAQGNPQPRSRFPQFGSFRIWMGDGEADYDAINLGLRARLTNKLEMQGFYTYSEAEGNVLAGADSFQLTDTNHQPDWSAARDASVDPLDPKCDACFGPLDTDARHRITLSAFYRAPWDVTVGSVIRYRSALPYTRINTGVDTNGDGVPDDFDLNDDGFRQDLQPGVEHVNDGRGASFTQVDLRLAKMFRVGDEVGVEVIGEVFNLFDSDNPARFNRTGTPTSWAGDPLQGEQRLMQLGARVTF